MGKYIKDLRELQKNAAQMYAPYMGFNDVTMRGLAEMPVQADLSPLMGLVDSWTGSKLAQSYKAPESGRQRQAAISGLQKANAGMTGQITAEEMNALKAAAGLQQFDENMKWKYADLQARKDIASQPKASAADKPVEPKQWQWENASHAGSMLRGKTIIQKLTKMYPKKITSFEAKFENGKFYPGGYTDPILRQYAQAQQSFINAILRKESGAAISEAEYEMYGLQYIPRWGDGPQTINQKFAEQDGKFNAMVKSSGPAWELLNGAEGAMAGSGGSKPKPPKGPKRGQVIDGYEFIGDENDPKTWGDPKYYKKVK